MKQKNKFYVTTPIYYGTAKPHLGSLYSTLLADVAARWHKLLGQHVFFLTGTDEHGQKIAQAAEKAGLTPKEFVDQFIPAYKYLWKEYEIDYSYFIRTTDQNHKQAVQQWLQLLIEKGFIYKDFYTGWYCTSCETFVTQDVMSAQAPACPSCGRDTEKISEESYYFKLSAFQQALLAFYEQNPDFIIPKERAAEVINFVKSGLKDLSISRTTVKWGIPFPGDNAHVTYVWADALTNYITAIGYLQPGQEEQFNYWWPADLQIIGKDILRFHAVYWPAFLMASELPLPKHLLVHGWIKIDDKKMSKSFGNVVDPQQLYDTYGADEVRYYLVREFSIAQDTEFSIQHLETRISADLANDLGNLLNRVVTLAEKNGMMTIAHPSVWSEKSMALRDACWDMIQVYAQCMDECSYHLAAAAVWKFIGQTNAYFHEMEPWKLAKLDKYAFQEVLSATCHSLKIIASILWPIMPSKMELLLASLGQQLHFTCNIIEHIQDGWQATFVLEKIDTLFKKYEQKEEKAMTEEEKQPEANHITIDDFAKVELVLGTIIDCQEIPKSEKLYKLLVDFGTLGKRQILSGIKQHFAPADLIGKQATFVYNLAPRKMMGYESQGMLLTAHNEQGNLQLIMASNTVPNGKKLR